MFTYLLPLLNKVVEIKKHWYFRFAIVFPNLTGNVAAIMEFADVLTKIKNFATAQGVSLKNPPAPVVNIVGTYATVAIATGYTISIFRTFTDEGAVRQVIHCPAASVPLGELLYLIGGLDVAFKTAANIR